MHCLQCFRHEIELQNHNKDCIVMPPEGSKAFFKNHHKQLPAPFVIYADFEAITKIYNLSARQRKIIYSNLPET